MLGGLPPKPGFWGTEHTRHSSIKFLIFLCEYIRKTSYRFDLSYDRFQSENKNGYEFAVNRNNSENQA